MISYEWFQFAVLGQVLVWFNLYHRVKLPEWVVEVFYLCGATAAMWLYVSGFKIGYYSNILLIEYVFMTMGAVFLYSQRFTASQALSLGFLTVFINSFYWELPLHVLEWVTVGFQVYMLPQLWRLSPVPFLFRNFKFERNAAGLLLVGVAVSVGVAYLNYLFFRGPLLRGSLFLVNRVVCLLMLVKVISEAKKIEL